MSLYEIPRLTTPLPEADVDAGGAALRDRQFAKTRNEPKRTYEVGAAALVVGTKVAEGPPRRCRFLTWA